MGRIENAFRQIKRRHEIAFDFARSDRPWPNEDIVDTDRRRVLGLLFSAGVVGVAAGSGILRDPIEGREANKTRIYKDGEILSHPIAPKVNGWGVTIEKDRLDQFVKQNPTAQLSVTLHHLPSSDNRSVMLVAEKEPFSTNVSYAPMIEGFTQSPLDRYPVAKVKQDGTTVISLRTLPDIVNESPSVLEIALIPSDKTEMPTIQQFVIHTDSSVYPQDGGLYLVSEAPLHPVHVAELQQTQAAFASVFDIGGAVYIADTNRHPETAEPFMDKDDIIIDTASFQQPEYWQQGEAALSHRQFTNLFTVLDQNVYDDKTEIADPVAEYKKAHKALFEQMTADLGHLAGEKLSRTLTDEALHHPAFRLFDDIQLAEITDGHIQRPHFPYPTTTRFLDYEVLFASAMTTFRYFPQEFIEGYRQLSPSHKAVTKQLAESCLAVADARVGYVKSQNQKLIAIQSLLPGYDAIKEALQH